MIALQSDDAIAAVHLDFGSVAKARAQWRCGFMVL
jgi:hypothetical protein